MAETKFTPGPWKWEIDGQGTAWAAYELSPGVLLTDFGSGTPWGDEIDRANAHLIAAAPDLYNALDDLVRYTNPDPGQEELFDAARTALAKSRGEANG